MPLFTLILILFFVIIYFGLNQTKSISILKMSLWLVISYSFLLLTHLFSGITYYVGSITRILPYFLLCLILILIGDHLGKKVRTSSRVKFFKVKLMNLTYASIFGSFLLLFDILRLNGIFFGTRIDDFKISIIGVLGNMLASLGLIAWLTSLYENRINMKKISSFSYLAILAYVAGGVLSAGRQAIILIILSSVILMIWSARKRKELKLVKKKNKPWGILVIIILFVSYFLFISFVRSGIFDINNKISSLEKVFNAKVSDETLKDVYQIEPLSDIYIESLFYYSHQLTRLDLLYQNYDYHPLFGLSQLSYFERRLQFLLGKQNEDSWKEVEIALDQKGRFGSHTWGTFISNYIIDFGRLGTLLVCFLTGFLIGIFYRTLKYNETSERIVRRCILLAGVVFSIQFSPLSELIWFFPLVISSFIKIKTKLE